MTRKDLDEIFSKAKKYVNNQVIDKKTKQGQVKKTRQGISRGTSADIAGISKVSVAKPSRKSCSSADPFGLTPTQNSNNVDFTEEGWKVYTPEELNIGKGGDTPECPFDCNCCF